VGWRSPWRTFLLWHLTDKGDAKIFAMESQPESSTKIEVLTPLGFRVRTSHQYWQILLEKHPDIAQFESQLPIILVNPQFIYQSKTDKKVFLFYQLIKAQRWLTVVVKQLNGDGFIVTCYQTSAIKKGKLEWSQ